MTYHELDVINGFLDLHKSVVSHYAFIRHNKDFDIDKDAPEVTHFHLLLVFKREKSLKWIQTEFDSIARFHQNTLGERITDKVRAFRYLTHKDEDDSKHHYDDNEVCHNGLDYWSDEAKQSLDVCDMLNDFDNNCNLRYMAIKYGRDFMKNYNSYYNYYCLIRSQELMRKATTIVDTKDEDLPF